MREFITKLKKIIKNQKNWPIIGLCILVLIISFFMIGLIKTIFLFVAIGLLLLIMKYGGIQVSKHGKKIKLNKKTKKLMNYIGLGALILGIGCLIVGTIFITYIVLTAPKFDPKLLYRKEASTIYASDNTVVAKIGKEIRDKVTYDQLPQVLVDAIIATEDSRFFQHNGFDLPRFLKATLGHLGGNGGAGGASTITMQVSKNNFTYTKPTITRKFTDIYVSIFEIEKHYSKQQILEFYVNAPYLGDNSYGVAEASRNYFGKDVKDLNLAEASLLAGIFNAPAAYDPTIYPDKAEARRSTVLHLMRIHGYITAEEEKIANSIPVTSLLKKDQSGTSSRYQGYVDVVVNEVISKTGNDPYNVPMNIYTNLMPSKQDYLNSVLSGDNYKWENNNVQAGIAVTNINTGAIVAIGNGRNRQGSRLFNYATMLKRQIGSTAKPIFDYGPGIEFNNWSTGQTFLDDSYTYSNGTSISDWDGQYDGLMTMRNAIAESRNIPALKAFQQVDNASILQFALSLGMTPEVSNGYLFEAHSIGGFTGTSPLQMAAAYAAFGNGGYYIEPHAVNKVQYIDTGIEKNFTYDKTRVMSDATAFMITDILRYAVDSGAIAGGKTAGVQVCAKTGTSNYDSATKKAYHLPSNAINDLWYTGYDPDYAIGMWYGYEKTSSTTYSRLPASTGYRDRLFTALAKGLFDKNGETFEAPKSVTQVAVERDTIPIMLPSKYTPDSMISYEYFKKGTEPTDVSPRFDQLPNPTGLDVKKDGPNVTLSWNNVAAPNTVTQEYLDTIKGHEDKYLKIRSNYDAANLGTIGYNIYVKQSDGSLSLLDFTLDNKYTYAPSNIGSGITYVVKTCYTIFKSNMSSGSEFTYSNSSYVPIVDISLDGTNDNLNINWAKGQTYVEPNPDVVVLDNLVNVTSSATINITTTKFSANQTTSGINVDVNNPDKYIISYNVTYKGVSETLTRTIIVQ